VIASAVGPLALSAEAWLELLACRARLRLPQLLAASSFLRCEMTEAPRASRGAGRLDLLLAAFDRAVRAQPRVPGCLPRSLALRRFLARHGQDARIGLGLRRRDGRLQGHAWVEADGAVVTRDADFVREFVPLVTGRTGPDAAWRTDG
jgi:hypothetical protein